MALGAFHSPKDLAASPSIEAAKVLEPLQWLSEEQSRRLDEAGKVAQGSRPNFRVRRGFAWQQPVNRRTRFTGLGRANRGLPTT